MFEFFPMGFPLNGYCLAEVKVFVRSQYIFHLQNTRGILECVCKIVLVMDDFIASFIKRAVQELILLYW